jgi:UDP-N-acetylmuramyl tripeptide synthase
VNKELVNKTAIVRIGTRGNHHLYRQPDPSTTPEDLDIQALLAELMDAGLQPFDIDGLRTSAIRSFSLPFPLRLQR